MLALPKILFPVDLSEQSVRAARYAKTLACRFHSELDLVHVVDLRVFGVYGMGNDEAAAVEFAPGCQEAGRVGLEGFLPDEFRNLHAKRVLLYGDPAREIVKYADANRAELIVMATHGYGPYRRFLLGSVTAKVLQDAHCPVWTGAHLDQAAPNGPAFFRQVLCAVDFDAAGERGLRWAAAFAAEFQANLTLVHALPPIYTNELSHYEEGQPMALRELAQQRAAEIQNLAGTSADLILETGPVAKVVRDVAKRLKGDLVVIARHEKGNPLGRLHDNGYAIVRDSPCPVVSV